MYEIDEDDINNLTPDQGLRRFLKDHIEKAQALPDPPKPQPKKEKPANGNGKEAKGRLSFFPIKSPKTTLSIMGGSAKVDYTKYEPVSDETISLQVSGILPQSDKLRFIDPQAVALPNKAIPRVKVVLDKMSTSVKKSQLPFIAIGIMVIISAIALSIVYDRLIAPAQEAERAYNLEVMKHGGNSTGLSKPESLFQFKPINPFEKPPTP